MTATLQTWRGVTFHVQVHAGCTQWVSDDAPEHWNAERWKATQYRVGEFWFARLRVGTHVYTGSGDDPREALDAARATATQALTDLRDALRKRSLTTRTIGRASE